MENLTVYKTTNDINGNPRYVVHYLAITPTSAQDYDWVIKQAKKIDGRKYHNKKFGGGIVFCNHDMEELRDSINRISGNNYTSHSVTKL